MLYIWVNNYVIHIQERKLWHQICGPLLSGTKFRQDPINRHVTGFRGALSENISMGLYINSGGKRRPLVNPVCCRGALNQSRLWRGSISMVWNFKRTVGMVSYYNSSNKTWTQLSSFRMQWALSECFEFCQAE